MKYVSILAILVWLMGAGAVGANADVAVNLKKETLESLGHALSAYHKKLIEEMPEKVRFHLSSIEKPKSIHDLKNEDSIRWIHHHVSLGPDEGLSKKMDELMSDLAVSGDKLHGDDVASIYESSFFALWNKDNFDLEKSIVKSAIYWRENSDPPHRLSPDGLNVIEWNWKLDVKSRESGVLHVGIDEKKRTFICYEYTVGLYFPEGETLERIYREIVQDPDMAGQFLGKGRKQKLERIQPKSHDKADRDMK
ncbi:hypothetical protein SAMN02745181_0686 [Rubritalea squalenifaciens DSM 18772]|uniref:Uncharacterized protein n=1 Tax=Rubritalea squalenifaciens DSM 18772 TaxID=1123071 RepID=A0A1M6DAB6_9BACT|nr:hypothetical protein [Rubritalea squalenifaciens]SHI70174.1 hypothetical protein SAMN02745181_0686 [Rubritalea squalenifaciens DSM 18772]